MSRKFMAKLKSALPFVNNDDGGEDYSGDDEYEYDTADWETTMECLELMESGYYDGCMCGYNGCHNEDAEEAFYGGDDY